MVAHVCTWYTESTTGTCAQTPRSYAFKDTTTNYNRPRRNEMSKMPGVRWPVLKSLTTCDTYSQTTGMFTRRTHLVSRRRPPKYLRWVFNSRAEGGGAKPTQEEGKRIGCTWAKFGASRSENTRQPRRQPTVSGVMLANTCLNQIKTIVSLWFFQQSGDLFSLCTTRSSGRGIEGGLWFVQVRATHGWRLASLRTGRSLSLVTRHRNTETETASCAEGKPVDDTSNKSSCAILLL